MSDGWDAFPAAQSNQAPAAGGWDAFPAASAAPAPPAAPRSALGDFFASMPRGIASGFTNALSNIGTSGAIDAQFSGVPTADPAQMPTGEQGVQKIESATGPLPQPQGMAGRFGAAVGEGLGNPATYLGPGSLPLKIGGSIMSTIGGQAGAETGVPGAALAGSLAGGLAAVKTLGPKQAVAAVPTAPELKAAAKAGYKEAAESGLQIAPSGLFQVAENAKQDLIREGFDPDSKVFKLLNAVQKVPDNPQQYVSSQSFDIFNRRLQRISGETQMGRSGPEPTPDAAAAAAALQHFKEYGQNIPERDVVAGSAPAYRDALGQANQNYGAYKRVQGVDQRIDNAQINTDGSNAANLANQVKSQLRPILKNPKLQRGFTPDEVNAVNGVNKGTLLSNTLNQLGRGGAGVVPLGIHAIAGIPAAFMTGGASILPQAAIAAGLYGARKAGERMTLSQAQALLDTLAKRSPLYQSRLNALSSTSTLPNPAQLLRSGILGLR